MITTLILKIMANVKTKLKNTKALTKASRQHCKFASPKHKFLPSVVAIISQNPLHKREIKSSSRALSKSVSKPASTLLFY